MEIGGELLVALQGDEDTDAICPAACLGELITKKHKINAADSFLQERPKSSEPNTPQGSPVVDVTGKINQVVASRISVGAWCH